MSYATHDFSESLSRVGIAPANVAEVLAAWGHGSGQGEDLGRGWSADGVTEWTGGFLCRLHDGRFAYISGWCDYTGWGCQDGATVQYFDTLPDRTALRDDAAYEDEPEYVPDHANTIQRDWDESPMDLNRWLANGATDPYGLSE